MRKRPLGQRYLVERAIQGVASCTTLLHHLMLWQYVCARRCREQALASLARVRYTRRMKTINVSAFQAQCLALLEEVAKTGEPVTILKHGTPVAQLVPSPPPSGPHAQTALLGTVHLHGDIEAPVLPPEAWEAEGPSHP